MYANRALGVVHHLEIRTLRADSQGKLHQSNLHLEEAPRRSLAGRLALQTIRVMMALLTGSIKPRNCQYPSPEVAWVRLHAKIYTTELTISIKHIGSLTIAHAHQNTFSRAREGIRVSIMAVWML